MADTRRLFAAQGVLADERLLVEVTATLARLVPSYIAEDAQLCCGQSSEGGT